METFAQANEETWDSMSICQKSLRDQYVTLTVHEIKGAFVTRPSQVTTNTHPFQPTHIPCIPDHPRFSLMKVFLA